MYINLKTRSYYSMAISSISIDDIVNFATKNKQEYVSLIDINVMYGALEFYSKAKAAGLKPIIGLSFFINNEEYIFIAKNYNGYIKLCGMSSCVCHNKDLDPLIYACDDLIVISKHELKGFKNHFAPEQLALHEALFVNKQDYKKYKALLAFNQEVMYDDVQENQETANKYLLTQDEANKVFSKEQIETTNKLIKTIDLSIDLDKQNHFVKFSKQHSSHELLKERCRQGFIRRFGEKVEKKYIDRVNYELDIIHKMGFDDYFLVVQDYVAFAKQNNIAVGPGRGSAAGSLVSYVLNITDIDPLKYGLIFERFLNSERKTKPDIDIDFMDNRRQEIFDYLFSRYGQDKVAHIITFQKIKIKTAIRDIGRILNIELPTINMICKNISDWYDTDIEATVKEKKVLQDFESKYPKLFELAKFIMGIPRQIGTHAAGIVICDKPLDQVLPTTLSAEGTNTTQYSMEYIESVGLIKMDILGLVNLSIIADCVDEINKHASKKFDIDKIPLDDQKVFNQLTQGNTIGIFQLESPGMTRVVRQIKPKNIEDISIASALFRPGPQANIPLYLDNRKNPDKIQYVNEKLKPILAPTCGIIVYQEQVIQVLCEVANWTLAQADIVRRAISKKKLDKLLDIEKEFVSDASENGYSKDDANKIFQYLLRFASYGFNHSHSIAYALVSYQLAYLKTYYPREFYSCLLTYNNGATAKVAQYLHEAKQNGITILPPSINYSQAGFSLHNKKIIFGFGCLKGIGFETLNKIIKARGDKKFKSINEAFQALSNAGVGESAVETLIKAGCFDELFDSAVPNRISLLTSLHDAYSSFKNVTAKYGKIGKTTYIKVEQTPQQTETDKKSQFAILGITFDKHPVEVIKNKNPEDYKDCFTLNYVMEQESKTNKYKVLVYINSIRKIKTKTGIDMAWISCEDETRLITNATCFSNILHDPIQSKMLDKQKFLLIEINKSSSSIKINKIIKEVDK